MGARLCAPTRFAQRVSKGRRRALREEGVHLWGWGLDTSSPHDPLTPGEAYEAYLKVCLGSEVREFTWRFSVAGQSDLRPLRVAPSLELLEGR